MSFNQEENNIPADLNIKGRSFHLVKIREHAPVRVFKGDNQFLRLGPKELLQPEIDFHQNLLTYGFPVPEIIDSGEVQGQLYYVETSLGDELFGDGFWHDCQKEGKISQHNFNTFLNISECFARAQLNSVTSDKNEESFYLGAHMDIIQQELPDLQIEILAAFSKAKQNTGSLPFVLTHGDLNPYNFLERGVIDFGNAFQSPAGYDLVSNINHIYFFPPVGDYEMTRRYEFSSDQTAQYYEHMDRIYLDAGLGKLSKHIDDFIFCRAAWASTKMHNYPKVQQYRYDKLRQLIKQYTNGDTLDITSS